ncbi:MAG: hypothetical protein WCI67_09125 [Chloroflexales bacterium]
MRCARSDRCGDHLHRSRVQGGDIDAVVVLDIISTVGIYRLILLMIYR